MKKLATFILSVFVLSLALSACGGTKTATITVDMSDNTFNPATVEVPAGAEVTLNLSNSGTVEHEFVIMKLGTQVSQPFDDNDESNVYWEAELDAGESATVTFTAPSDAGTYELVCGTPGHLELGMLGSLIVK
jgi:uncharacterized cupredoxin-like copper-binding protein